MPLDPKVEAAKRQAMAKVFEKTQREMASLVDELALTKRLPVPYRSNHPVPEVSLPYPQDSHLIESKFLIPQRKLPFYVPDDVKQNPTNKGPPWAQFTPPQPNIFDVPVPVVPVEPPVEPPLDEEMYRTRVNEWTLQKNAYNPDIASQMRCACRPRAEQEHSGVPPRHRLPPRAASARAYAL